MTRSLRVGVVLLFVLGLPSCGYTDDNPAAARDVAQAYLDAYHHRDAHTVCRLLGPGQVALIASKAGGDCPAGAKSTFAHREPVRRAGSVQVQMLKTSPSATVNVIGYGSISLLRLASTWRIVAGPRIRP
jgi:hypothetical protein